MKSYKKKSQILYRITVVLKVETNMIDSIIVSLIGTSCETSDDVISRPSNLCWLFISGQKKIYVCLRLHPSKK